MKGVLLIAIGILAGCTSTETIRLIKCKPERQPNGQVMLLTPCIGWSNGREVTETQEGLHQKAVIIYKDGRAQVAWWVNP